MGVKWYFVLSIVCINNVYSGWTPFHAVLYSSMVKCDHNKSLALDVSEVQVFFYDFANNFNITYPIYNAVEGIINNYNLDMSKRFILFVPGYKSHISKTSEELIRQTFRDVPNIYLIIIDHSAYTSSRGGRVKSYERSVKYAYYIGTALGELLTGFHRKGLRSRNIHCIGYSLGSQMLGHTGTKYLKDTSEKIWRITAIDPAGPCFSNSFISEQIRSGVAKYVEAYHCNAGGLGTTSVLADADFFINYKGKSQPHCDWNYVPFSGEYKADKCSHKACLRYWAKTVHQPLWYLAWACDSYKDFRNGKCAGNQVAIAGYFNPGNATGVFFASTSAYGD